MSAHTHTHTHTLTRTRDMSLTQARARASRSRKALCNAHKTRWVGPHAPREPSSSSSFLARRAAQSPRCRDATMTGFTSIARRTRRRYVPWRMGPTAARQPRFRKKGTRQGNQEERNKCLADVGGSPCLLKPHRLRTIRHVSQTKKSRRQYRVRKYGYGMFRSALTLPSLAFSPLPPPLFSLLLWIPKAGGKGIGGGGELGRSFSMCSVDINTPPCALSIETISRPNRDVSVHCMSYVVPSNKANHEPLSVKKPHLYASINRGHVFGVALAG